MATKKTSKAAPAKTIKKNTAPASARPSAKAHTGKAPAKKAAPAKPAPKPAPKASAKPKAVKAAPPKAAAPQKDLSKKIVKTAPIVHKPAPKAVAKPAPKAAPAADHKKAVRFNKSDLDQFKVELLAMRDRITGQSGSMRNAALQRTDEVNPEEDGTDSFLRLQTLEQVSSQQQIITNIDEALRAIEKGTYGVCDMCSELISKPRLSVLPFAKNCIKCQSEMENPRRVGRR